MRKFALATLLLVFTFSILFIQGMVPSAHQQAASPPSSPAPTPASARQEVDDDAAGEARTLATPSENKDSEKPTSHSFDRLYNELVALARASAGQVEQTHIDGTAHKARASELVGEIVSHFHDCGQRILRRLDAQAFPWTDATAGVERAVAAICLDLTLQFQAKQQPDKSQLSLLVLEMLERMAHHADYATLVTQLLAHKPYLSEEHEGMLLDLSMQSQLGKSFLEKQVKILLLTLWSNMKNTPAEGSYEDLLWYFEDQKNQALQSAAMERLLASDKYRHLVIERLVASKNDERMYDAAAYAARTLEPEVAIAIVAELKSAAEETHFGQAYMTLAQRHAEALGKHYEHCLGNANLPRHREQAIMALGHYSGSSGLEYAKMAFQNDPNHRVRGVALLAIASSAANSEFERCFDVAIADSEFHSQLGIFYLANSLSNHARRAETNFLDRASRAVLDLPGIKQPERATVENIRRQYLAR